jgi:hypothetical protein
MGWCAAMRLRYYGVPNFILTITESIATIEEHDYTFRAGDDPV